MGRGADALGEGVVEPWPGEAGAVGCGAAGEATARCTAGVVPDAGAADAADPCWAAARCTAGTTGDAAGPCDAEARWSSALRGAAARGPGVAEPPVDPGEVGVARCTEGVGAVRELVPAPG